MTFPVASVLLDACVLGVLSQKPTYGYDLTQRIKTTIDVSESTLYPVLRRLSKDGFLDTYDEPFDGRNRRYYRITQNGNDILERYIADWQIHKQNIDILLMGGLPDEQK